MARILTKPTLTAVALLTTFSLASFHPMRVHANVAAANQVESATYQEVKNWAQLPAGTKWGGVSSVAVDAKGNVYAFQRHDEAIVFTKDNTMYVAAGAPDNSVWIATADGKIIETIKGLEDSPHMIDVAPDGTIYVASAGGGDGSLVKLVKKKS